MGDVFKTQEVLQRIPGKPSSQDPMRIVRGVYISGPYLPIQLNTNAIMITGITCKKASIVDYTMKDTSTIIDDTRLDQHGAFALCDIGININSDIVILYNTTMSCKLDDVRCSHGVFGISDIDVNADYVIELYKSIEDEGYMDKYDHGSFALCDVDVNTTISYDDYYKIYGYPQYDDCIMIRDIQINKAVITNGS